MFYFDHLLINKQMEKLSVRLITLLLLLEKTTQKKTRNKNSEGIARHKRNNNTRKEYKQRKPINTQ